MIYRSLFGSWNVTHSKMNVRYGDPRLNSLETMLGFLCPEKKVHPPVRSARRAYGIFVFLEGGYVYCAKAVEPSLLKQTTYYL